ncbi:MAG: hypothetical protein PHS82_14045 [Lachnospiraceae bacterium]|nr:hypothetical protein [Lachnospiraceae bacterium]
MTEYFEDLENVVPNTPVTKIPMITNIGKNPCYVRALVKIVNPEGQVVEGQKVQPDLLTIEDLGINGEDWYIGDTRADGYTEVYYQQVLTSVNEAILFRGFTIPNWNNSVADKSLSIDIKAEAIQSERFDPIRDKKTDQIISWDEQDIIEYQE